MRYPLLDMSLCSRKLSGKFKNDLVLKLQTFKLYKNGPSKICGRQSLKI